MMAIGEPPPFDIGSKERPHTVLPRLICPRHDVGASVRVKPLEDMAGRVVELVRTAEEGWIYVVRYIVNGEAKTMRCFPDEIEEAAP